MRNALRLGRDQALAFRLARQHLSTPAEDCLDAVNSLLGAQAQVQSAAILQIRARTRNVTEDTVKTLLDSERRLIKLWGQRATLHLLHVDDLPLILALRGHFTARYRQWLISEGLTAEQVDRLAGAIGETLAIAPHSRAELSAALTPALGEWARPWLEHPWGGAIKLASTMGLVCHGPSDQGKKTFVRLDRWVDLPDGNGGDPITDLARRYLQAFGPATPQDFSKFTGLGVGAASRAFSNLREELIAVDIDGQASQALRCDEQALRDADVRPDRITVLPHFDPYLLAHADTAQYLDPRFRKRVYRTAGWIAPTILRGGKVIATWRQRRKGRSWRVEISPFGRFGKTPVLRATRQLRHLAAAFGVDEVEIVVRR